MVKRLEEDLDWVSMQTLPLYSEYHGCLCFLHPFFHPLLFSFRLGKMYRYTLEKFDPESMANFVEGFYKNLPAENIPPPKTPL